MKRWGETMSNKYLFPNDWPLIKTQAKSADCFPILLVTGLLLAAAVQPSQAAATGLSSFTVGQSSHASGYLIRVVTFRSVGQLRSTKE